MIPSFCDCGITIRFWKGDVAICPRCRWIYLATAVRLVIIKGQPADEVITTVETWMDEAVAVFMPEELKLPHDDVWKAPDSTFQDDVQKHPIEEEDSAAEAACAASKAAMLRKTMEDAGMKVTDCDQCGGPIEDKCGAICKGCRWMKPCSLE